MLLFHKFWYRVFEFFILRDLNASLEWLVALILALIMLTQVDKTPARALTILTLADSNSTRALTIPTWTDSNSTQALNIPTRVDSAPARAHSITSRKAFRYHFELSRHNGGFSWHLRHTG